MAHLFIYNEFPADILPYRPVDDYSGDGYDWIDVLPFGWHAVRSWGTEGWDLGSLPYQVVAHYECPVGRTPALAHFIKGDVTVRAFGSREARDAATDEIALSIWRREQNGPSVEDLPAKDTPAADIPARFRGPYRPATQSAHP